MFGREWVGNRAHIIVIVSTDIHLDKRPNRNETGNIFENMTTFGDFNRETGNGEEARNGTEE